MRTRAEDFAVYIIENNSTIRKCANYFKISKSTVHNDLSKRLKSINKFLYIRVSKVLSKNFSEKHIRGGIATKNKFEKLRNHTTMQN